MATLCIAQVTFGFEPKGKPIVVAFDLPHTSSDGGTILLKSCDGVRVIYDWMGGFGKTSRGFWTRLRASSVEVRCYNAPRLASPFGWLSRDHRKNLTVDTPSDS